MAFNFILLRKGVTETLTSGQTATGVSANAVTLNAEYLGARISYQVQKTSGTLASVTFQLVGSLDGVNFHPIDAPAAITTAPTGAQGNAIYGTTLAVSGLRNIAFNISAISGAGCTIAALISVQ